MLRRSTILVILIATATAALPVQAISQMPLRTKVGILTCDISAGIGLIITAKKNLACMFTPSQPGTRELYAGSIVKHAPDLGATTGSEMIWAVFAPSNKRFGALAGHYGGANMLVGGANRTVTLQAVFLQGEAGPNVAAGVAELDLRPAR